MLLFRSLIVGMLGACFLLLASYEPPTVQIVTVAPPAPRPPATAAATLIDVAPTVRPDDVSALVRLEPGEHVVTVDDTRVANDLAAGVAIVSQAGHHDAPHGFVDLGVEGPAGPRRVLLLLH